MQTTKHKQHTIYDRKLAHHQLLLSLFPIPQTCHTLFSHLCNDGQWGLEARSVHVPGDPSRVRSSLCVQRLMISSERDLSIEHIQSGYSA